MTAKKGEGAEVVVVGGGIIGLAVAWRARQRGLSVTVLDRGPLGAGASHVAAGMLAPVSEAEYGEAGHALLDLGLESLERWPAFAAELAQASGVDPGLRAGGTLQVARDQDEAESLERELAFRQRLGLSVRRMPASEARRLEPALAPGLRLALELPQERCVDPRLVCAGLASAAQRAGASLRPGTAVQGLALDEADERVIGVRLSDGRRLDAQQVVVAAGAWSGALSGLARIGATPVRPVKGQILRLRDPDGPGLLDRALRFERGYLVPRGDGRYILGATVEERGFDASVTAGAVSELLRDASEIIPGVAELELEEIVAGLRPGTPDNLPILGPGVPAGLHWATGHYRNGVLLAPLSADVVVSGLCGEALPALADAGAPQRFAVVTGAPVEESGR